MEPLYREGGRAFCRFAFILSQLSPKVFHARAGSSLFFFFSFLLLCFFFTRSWKTRDPLDGFETQGGGEWVRGRINQMMGARRGAGQKTLDSSTHAPTPPFPPPPASLPLGDRCMSPPCMVVSLAGQPYRSYHLLLPCILLLPTRSPGCSFASCFGRLAVVPTT